MADEPQISILDARLAEIDRRLRTIQTDLADDSGVEPESGAGLAPRIAVPEPGETGGIAEGPVAPAPPEPARPNEPDDEAVGGGSAADRGPDEDPTLIIAELRGLISDHARLLDGMGDLLARGERLLAPADAPVLAEGPSRGQPPAAPASAPPVTVTAGPFSSLEAVRGFERSLQLLPNVVSVHARGFEGGDRAVIDVHLSPPNP